MAWWPLDLTASNAPELLDNEVNVFAEPDVGLYQNGDKIAKFQSGWLHLTSHRICYVDNALPAERSVYLSLRDIDRIEYVPGFLTSSPKICLELAESSQSALTSTDLPPWICPICTFTNDFPVKFVFGVSENPVCNNCGVAASAPALEAARDHVAPAPRKRADPANGEPCPRCTFRNHASITKCEMCSTPLRARHNSQPLEFGRHMKLSFRSSGSRQFYGHLQTTLAARAWTQVPKSAFTRGSLSGKSSLGIHRLQQTQSDSLRHTDNVLRSAFNDLDSLAARADEVVKLAETLQRSNVDVPQFLVLDTAHVSRELCSDTKSYHELLSRQIVDFLEKNDILGREGGIMTIFDVYAVYNRARVLDLVSPEDLNASLELAASQSMPIRVRRLKSGLKVIEKKSYVPALERLRAWIAELPAWQADAGVSAVDVCNHFGWSLAVATEELEQGEAEGILCRDEQLGGVHYFLNLICTFYGSEAVPTSA